MIGPTPEKFRYRTDGQADIEWQEGNPTVVYGDAIFLRQCPHCARFVTADSEVWMNEDYGPAAVLSLRGVNMTNSKDLIMTGATADECWPLVRDFHYSKRMSTAIKHCYAWRKPGGLFGDTGEVLACVIYGQPVNRNWPHDALELQRLVRRNDFTMPLSQFLSWSLRWLREHTNTPFVLSYADSNQNHHGGIYQASGFFYVYASKEMWKGNWVDSNGDMIHGRTLNSRYGSCSRETILNKHPDWVPAHDTVKHLYVKPLRQKLKSILRQQTGWQQLPYPKPDNATRLLDAPSPEGVSQEHTLGVAP